MRAMTVKQPWASLIASGEKRIENRSWRPPAALIGERIAIHAGAGWDKSGEKHTTARRGDLPQSRVVATAVIDCVLESSDDPYWIGPLAWSPEETTIARERIAAVWRCVSAPGILC